MSIARKVLMTNAIGEVVDNTSELFLNQMPVLMKWAKQSWTRINGIESCPVGKQHIICKENTAELPLNAIHVDFVFLGHVEALCEQIYPLMEIHVTQRTTGGVDNVYLWSAAGSPSGITLNWQIQNNNIVFDQHLDGKEVTIFYRKIDSDAEGNPMILEQQVPPIGKFVEWKLGEKENAMKFRKGLLSPLDINYVRGLKREYHDLVAKCRPTVSEQDHRRFAYLLNYPFTGSSVI